VRHQPVLSTGYRTIGCKVGCHPVSDTKDKTKNKTKNNNKTKSMIQNVPRRKRSVSGFA
jgi:hypothetical protein